MSSLSYQLEQRVGVVTGGSSGIGLETVRLMLAAGLRVAFCGRDATRLSAAESALRGEFPRAELLAMRCDVLDAADTAGFAAAVEQRFGGTDVLVNNAGQGRVSRFADTGDAEWREELDLKFFSVIRPLRAFMSMLEKSPCAAVVCVNSLLAAQPEPHMVATSAARAGVLNLAHSLGIELAPKKIRVNSLLLGLVESGQWRRRYKDQAKPGQSWEDWTAELARSKGIPLGRLGRPVEAAQAILFLASPLSSYTTGATLDVSGGVDRHA
jgi:NAD(P)-dependent dehydrogenase (short-subunit alcohol dehydrogenase family)